MKSKTLTAHLREHFKDDAKYMLSNSFVFSPKEWESDLLVIQKNGMVHEVELKIGRNDYLLDHRKHKHRVFLEPFKKRYYPVYRKNVFNGDAGPNYFEIEWIKHEGPVPHRFSYACPTNLISFEECPRHAGLIWVSEEGVVTVVKVPPGIHGRPLDLRDILLEKFYWQATAFEEKWHKEIEAHEQTKKMKSISLR